jgi:NAD(P)-dependent dehydrogenase (short-subunit alcohol dehydrogenase family)
VTDAGAVHRLVTEVAEAHGHLDLLFNNAGIGAAGPVEVLGLEAWRAVVEVDLMGVVHGVTAAYPIMVRQESGHIVNTASLAGLVPSPLLTPYAAAKAGVVGLSVSLRVEAAAYGVGVSVLCPGPVETAMLSAGPPPEGSDPTVGTLAGSEPGQEPNVRKLLTNSLGDPYAPEALADDVLTGVLENRAFIVAPETARQAWQMFRTTPEEMLGVMERQSVRSRARRATSE